MKVNKKDILNIFLIFFGAGLLFIPFLGQVHLFDWDEINFAESAREMLLTKDFLTVQIDFKPFWEKPPLFIWFQALSMSVFGINEFAARFPNAIVGIFTLISLYLIGKKIYSRSFGMLWVFVYISSFLPFFYFKSGIIDPLFNLFIFLGVYFLINYVQKDEFSYKDNLLSAFFIGLSILTKGPVGLLIFGLTAFVYMIIRKAYKKILNPKLLLIYFLMVGFVGGFWFILQAISGKAYLIKEFFEYQIRLFSQKDAGHGGFLFYHFVILFFGVFPASIFAIKGFFIKNEGQKKQQDFMLWMNILFWTVLILFTIVKTKIVHYSSMCYLPLTFIAAKTIKDIIDGKVEFSKWMKILQIVIAFLIGIAVILISQIDKLKVWLINNDLITDKFVLGNLQAQGNWNQKEAIVGILFILIVVGAMFFKTNRKKIYGILTGSLLFIFLGMLMIVPRVEEYSQNAEIEIFKSLKDKDCYVGAYGYKTYAQYFYTDKKIPKNPKYDDLEWLIKGKVDKPVYIVCKNVKALDFLKNYSNFEIIKEKNGFVLLKRK